jgi:hypothetical protein
MPCETHSAFLSLPPSLSLSLSLSLAHTHSLSHSFSPSMQVVERFQKSADIEFSRSKGASKPHTFRADLLLVVLLWCGIWVTTDRHLFDRPRPTTH